MKKILTMMSVCVLCLALGIGLTACGGAKFTVTFDKNTTAAVTGMPAKIENVKKNTTIEAQKPTAPTLAEYAFGGWFKEAGCTNAWNFATDKVTANTTLYAKWTLDTVPGEVASFTAITRNAAVDLEWTAPESDGGNEITGYEIVYASTESIDLEADWEDEYDIILEFGDDEFATTITTNIFNDIEYTFLIRAINSKGAGAISSVAETPSSVLRAPVIEVTDTGWTAGYSVAFTIDWDDVPNAVDYYIEYRKNGESWGSHALATSATSSYEQTLSTTLETQDFDIRVRCKTAAAGGYTINTSLWSNVVTVTVNRTDEQPANIDEEGDLLVWDKPASFPTGYNGYVLNFYFEGADVSDKILGSFNFCVEIHDINIEQFDLTSINWAERIELHEDLNGAMPDWDDMVSAGGYIRFDVSISYLPTVPTYAINNSTYDLTFDFTATLPIVTTTVDVGEVWFDEESMAQILRWDEASDTGYDGYLLEFYFAGLGGNTFYATSDVNYFDLESFDWTTIGVPTGDFNDTISVRVSLNPVSPYYLPYYGDSGTGRLDDFLYVGTIA